jgi:DNA-directed RNA polymerase subunit M/transcription elongation factor TFIIS
MSTTKLGSKNSASRLIPLIAPTQATIKHLSTLSEALNEEYPANIGAAKNLQTINKKLKQNNLISFCPTCQMLLKVAKDYPPSLKCKKCGYRQKLQQEVIFGKKLGVHGPGLEGIAVIDKEKSDLRTYPIVHAICEKCSKTESETWTVAVGSEGTTSALTFLRCTNCGFTRREVG